MWAAVATVFVFRETREGSVMMLGRRDDIITTGITTTVVLVVAALDPEHASEQPPCVCSIR
jgi:hypothetical protein